jgi:hypothetical protein
VRCQIRKLYSAAQSLSCIDSKHIDTREKKKQNKTILPITWDMWKWGEKPVLKRIA